METNKYRYCFIDASYLIRRNSWACSRGKQPGEYNAIDIVKMCIQSTNKLARDYGVTADKYIMVFDSWSKEYQGYYRAYLIKDYVTYKSSRKFETIEELKRMEADPNISQEEIQKYAYRLYENQQRMDAKKILKNLGGIGIPAIWTESLEYDDLVYLAGIFMINDDKPSVIVTKDSDLKYCTTPNLDYFSLPTSGSKPEIITYDTMCAEIPENLREPLYLAAKKEYGSALYLYKALTDSLGDGHNDLERTKKYRTSTNQVILEILQDNYDNVEKKDLFLKQLETFKVFNFPKAMDAYQTICSIKGNGHYASIEDFHKFCDYYGIQGISDEYYQGFLNRLDQRLFSE